VAVRILLIDRDRPAVYEVQSTLAQAGYHVDHALPGRNAIRQVVLDEPDMVMLAIEADEAGWQFFRRVLSFLEVPLLLLLTGAGRLDRATALSQGAAACLLHPMSMVELQAQVQALLRQSLSPVDRRAKNFFVDGDLVVDLTRGEVKIDGSPMTGQG
jgi:DNA-binding response OmpR family regulator